MKPIRPAVQDWFSRKRFGLFLHFGLYSIEGWHEQDQMRRRIPRAVYGRQAARFNPTAFDPDELLDRAEEAGMEYICLTTKHHDGFCLWNTRETEFNVMNTPYGRDLIAEYAHACHRRKFPMGLYSSVADWHHPAYPNQGRHHELRGPEPGDRPDWKAYVRYLKRQVRELCTNYGEVRHFFWDMNVPEARDPSINRMIRELQPRAVINNRGLDDGDFGTPEREYEVPPSGYARPTEACNSVGSQSWGYRKNEDYTTPETLCRHMASMMGRGAHYLLNAGPDAAGRLPPQAVRTIRSVGEWYRKTREAFVDTVPAGTLPGQTELLLMRRGKTLYVVPTEPLKTDSMDLAPLRQMPRSAMVLTTGKDVSARVELLPSHWTEQRPTLRLTGLPRALLNSVPPVVRLEFARTPEGLGDGNMIAFKG